MARPLTVKFFRSEIVKKKIEALPEAMREPIRRAVANAGDKIVERAKALVPVDEGVLRDSIRWEPVKSQEGRYRAMIVVGPSGEFLKQHGRIPNLARWVEFGTAPATKGLRGVRFAKGGKLRQTENVSTRTHEGLPARPYLFPAWRQLKKQTKTMIADAVNRTLKTAAKKG
jgi:HK97 gp10 family phage protein